MASLRCCHKISRRRLPMGQETFPAEYKPISDKKALAADIYGNRFHADQTLYEYLIEFLLIFVSGDNDKINPKEKLRFHSPDAIGNLSYTVEPRMGLKRFIFFDCNKKDDAIQIDRDAYTHLIDALKKKFADYTDDSQKMSVLEALQDLLHGYAVILKKRTWCAQAMLPLCPELIFCEAMPKKKERGRMVWKDYKNDEEKERRKIDSNFDFTKRNFLSRGGELYYLHLLQGMKGQEDKRATLEYLLQEQLVEHGKKMSQIANFVQDTWEECMGYSTHPNVKINISFIPEAAYKDVAGDSVDELINFMSCEMHPVNKIELLAKGIMIQILRMLSAATAVFLNQERECWIMDIGNMNIEAIKKTAAVNFSHIRGTFTTAIGKNIDVSIAGEERVNRISKARKDSFDIFKSKGKELQCIIPTSGPYERFSLPEDCIRFLVLALIAPGQKMTLDMFLEKLYRNYRIVIGPVQYRKCSGDDIDTNLANSFNQNVLSFQELLKATGFLRELSDATSIVSNPYNKVQKKGGDEKCDI